MGTTVATWQTIETAQDFCHARRYGFRRETLLGQRQRASGGFVSYNIECDISNYRLTFTRLYAFVTLRLSLAYVALHAYTLFRKSARDCS